MKAKLLSRWGAQKGVEHFFSEETSIGRGVENELRLEVPAISKQHAKIFFDRDRGAYFLEDLGSVNGTELDGIPVTRRERLRSLQHIQFAAVADFLFVEIDLSSEEEKAPAGPQATDTMRLDEIVELPAVLQAAQNDPPESFTRIEDLPMILPEGIGDSSDVETAVPPAKAKPRTDFYLEVDDEGTTKTFDLVSGENVVGRARDSAIRLSSPELSRVHAVLVVSENRVTLRDLGSGNHTFVEGERIEAEVEIRPGTGFRFGLIEGRLLRRSDSPGSEPKEES